MAGLQYFFPKVLSSGVAIAGRLNTVLLRERGCTEAFAECRTLDDCARAEIAGKGPDGGPGIILAPLPLSSREPPRRLGFFPDDASVRWVKISELLWLGLDTALPPAPADLARRTVHPGYAVQLGDGQAWTVPVIRRPDGSPTLPRDIFLDEQGQLVAELREESKDLWEKTAWIVDLMTGGRTYNVAEGLRVCLAGLAHNYRVGQPEQRVLRLVTTENMERIFCAMVDVPFDGNLADAEDLAKKNGPPTSPSGGPGGPASIPATDPPAATSSS